MAAKKTQKISASVLAFDRRISSSNGIFYGLEWTQRDNTSGRPLPVEEKAVRGVIDHRINLKNRKKFMRKFKMPICKKLIAVCSV